MPQRVRCTAKKAEKKCIEIDGARMELRCSMLTVLLNYYDCLQTKFLKKFRGGLKILKLHLHKRHTATTGSGYTSLLSRSTVESLVKCMQLLSYV